MKKILLFLFFILINVASAFSDNITITPSALGLSGTSYQSNSTGVNVSGVTIKFTTCNNNNGIGMQKSTGCYWNSTEIPQKIDSIVFSNVSYSSSSNAGFYVYGSTSEKGTTTKIYDGNNTGKIIVDFTSYNYKYFYVQNKNTRAMYSGASIKIYYSQTITSYTAHFIDSLNHNFDSISTSTVLLPTPIILGACNSNRWEFDSWRNRNGVKISGNSIALSSDTTLYALYRILDRDENIEVIDTLTNIIIGISGQNYKNFSNVTQTSDAVYSGRMAGGDNTSGDAIQLRTKDSNEGIISTVSGGLLKHIKVVWNSATANDRALKIYTSDTVYHSPNDLYKYARCFDSISKGVTDLELNNKPYIGIRSKQSALYLNTIYITWLAKGDISYKYSYNPKCFSTDINVAEWFKDSVKFDVGNYDSIYTYKGELNSCDSIRIELTRNDSSCIRWFQVPIFGGAYTTDLNNQDCDVVILKDSILTINSNISNHDVKVYGGGRLIISENKTYTINSLSLRKVDDTNPYLTLNGNITLSGDSSFYFDMYTDPSEWRWLVLPDTFKIKNIKLSNGKSVVYGDDYLIKTYNGRTRAVNKKNGWLEVGDKKEFMPGEGFIFGIAGDGETKYEYRFKFANTTLNEDKRDKTLKWDSLKAWGCNEAVYGQLAPNHKGWNLIGNPFLDKLTTEIYSPIRIGHLIHSETDPWDGKWIVDPSETEAKLRYRIIYEKGTAGEDGNGYSSQLLDDIELEPFETFFVQLGGNEDDEPAPSILLNHEKRRNNIVRRMIMIEDEDDELFLRIFVNNKKTGMFISNKFTNDYEPGDDLESRQEIYQTIGGYRLLYSAIPDSTLIKGVTVHSPAGHLILDPKVDITKFEEIYVLYNNNWYDLLHGDELDIETGNFIVYAKRKQKGISTDIENISTSNYIKYFDKATNQVVIKYKNYVVTPEGKMIKAL